MHAIIKECQEVLYQAIEQEKMENRDDARCTSATVFCKDGYIEMYASKDADSYALVCHTESDNVSPLLEDVITGSLPDWWDVEVENTEIGLDPGFSSWQDYIDYKYY